MPHPPDILLEVAVDSVEGALAAEQGGAGRIELCGALEVGGLTPSEGLVEEVCRAVNIPVHVMLRPRAGDFTYSASDFTVMRRDLQIIKTTGASGVAFGLLDELRKIDVKRTRELLDLAKPLNVTFHRAFDLTASPERALEEIISAGAKSILTSGQAKGAQKGIKMLKRLVRLADGRIGIMAGAGIDSANIVGIIDRTGVREVHVASAVLSSADSPDNALEFHFGRRRAVDQGKVKQLCDLLKPR